MGSLIVGWRPRRAATRGRVQAAQATEPAVKEAPAAVKAPVAKSSAPTEKAATTATAAPSTTRTKAEEVGGGATASQCGLSAAHPHAHVD